MKNVEDLFPLTPMQRVMLLHSRARPGAQDALFHQFRFDLDGALDGNALEAAWNDAAALHPALRTCFVWEGVETPLQVVRQSVDVPFLVSDAAEGTPFEAQIAKLRAADRAEGFDLTRAPLIRLHLVRRDAQRATLLWSSHHLVLDRWCIGLVLADVGQAYASRLRGELPGTPRRGRFRDYVAHILSVPAPEVEAHWRKALSGARGAFRELPGTSIETGEQRAEQALPRAEWEALRSAARTAGVTPASLVQTALALTLAQRSGTGDVLFGATVAGRPPEVHDIETAVGTMIGNVPVRARLEPDTTAVEAARSLMRAAQARARYEFAAPTELHAFAGLRADERLFDVLLVQLDATAAGSLEGVTIEAEPGSVESPFALTVSVEESEAGLRVGAAASAAAGGSAHGWVEAFCAALCYVAAHPTDALSGFAQFDPPAPLAAQDPTLRAFPHVEATRSSGDSQAAAGRERDGIEIVEEFVLAEAARVLHVDAVDPDIGFFEQGGTSLTATQLHARIEAGSGRSIDILALFAAPSMRALSRAVQEAGGPLRGDVWSTLQAGTGDRPALVCIASPEVNALGYVSLTRHLPAEQRVELVQGAPDSDVAFRMAVSDIEPLAAAYAEALASRHAPGSTLRLIGMCDGALLAPALARALNGRGLRVDFVGVLNTHALGTLGWRFKLRRVGSRARYYRQRLLEKAGWRADQVPESASADEGTPDVAPRPGTSDAPGASKAELQARLARVNSEWFTLDTPRGMPALAPYDGEVTLFRIGPQPYWRVADPLLGWGRHAARVEPVRMEPYFARAGGGKRRSRHELHLSLLREPEVQGTAQAIEDAFARLTAGVTP